jgi:hypothetical protein
VIAKQFQEIGHSGFALKVIVKTEGGARQYALGFSGSSPFPTTITAVYALPEGIAVGTIQLGGIGQPWNPPPFQGCFSIFIGSDTEGRFGHKCPACGGYWRSEGGGIWWPMRCAYCGAKGFAHEFLTDGQRSYVRACCEWIQEALASDVDGEKTLKLDEVADKVAKGEAQPSFYYVEESQQNKFVCAACRTWNDVLGRFGYCSSCGTWNGLQELEADVARIREQANSATAWERSVQELVGAFDSVAKQYAKQLLDGVPLSARRRKLLERVLFHDLKARAGDLKTIFDVDVLAGLSAEDVTFAVMMFERRHVYEHNGGEADEKYLQASGDISVRPKQVIIETRENVHRLAGLITKMGRNLHAGFHELFPVEEGPVKLEQERKGRMKAHGREG